MELLDTVKALEKLSSNYRRVFILGFLASLGIEFHHLKYKTGINIVANVGPSHRALGISCHYDKVDISPGANDNASAIAVILDLVTRLKNKNHKVGVKFFFFDEEEMSCRGSTAYVEQFGIGSLIGLYNMELVGSGDHIAVWPKPNQHSYLFDLLVKRSKVPIFATDRVVAHSADHSPFLEKGLDTFTLTMISKDDLAVANIYNSSLRDELSKSELTRILHSAPLFKHYHQSTDTSEFIRESSLRTMSKTLCDIVDEVNI
jgi:Zn-dependent M28 family amino/carboxypeptidase